MSISKAPSMSNLLNAVNRVKELEETKKTGSSPSENDYLKKSLELTDLIRNAIVAAKKKHSKKEIIASILEPYPKCTIQLTFLGL
ncbi:MAG: hypothetical protein K1060chlam3_00788 [Candidatus Anoxychlamydiales bacterium]|nr:hypothetical protein [Candidatus Anoxychlamydiales bacterium]